MKTIEWNGMTITLDETGKSPSISIQSADKDFDVVVNEQTVYSAYEEKEYRLIPPIIRPFIEKHAYLLDEFEERKKPVVAADMTVAGESVTGYFKSNTSKPIAFRFISVPDGQGLVDDGLEERLEGSELELAKTNVKTLWDTLLETIQKEGYTFKLSHVMDYGYHGYWDVIVPLSDWNEEKFTRCAEAISTYVDSMKAYYEEN